MVSWIRLVPLLALGLIGCEDDDTAVIAECDIVPWTYTNTAQPFLMTWCTSCHHSDIEGIDRVEGTEGFDFDSYEGVLTYLDLIEARALAEEPTMPPAGGPTSGELDQLAEWIVCGAVE